MQEALAAERAQQATRQEQTPAQELGPVLEDQARDLEYERYSKCLERFQKMRPPSFGGEPDPEATDGWVMNIEKILKA